MARDRLLFIISFVILAVLAAFLFSRNSTPETPVEEKEVTPEKPSEQTVTILNPAAGHIIVPFELNSKASIVQFLTPDTTVDIRFTSKASLSLDTISLILLKNIRILGIGKDSAGKNYNEAGVIYKPNTPTDILLEMTPEEAEIFAYAEQSGTISLEIVKENVVYEHDELAEQLLKSRSNENFNSIIATYMIRSLFPKSKVKIVSTSKGFIVTGNIEDTQTADKIVKILQMISPDGEKSVVNLLEETQTIEVLEAVRDLKGGESLKENDYQWKKIQGDQFQSTWISRSKQTENLLKEAKLNRSVSVGRVLDQNDIVWPNPEADALSNEFSDLSPCQRAIPIPIHSRSPIVQFLKAGIPVNLRFTSKPDIGIAPISINLLKNLRVLAIRQADNGHNFDSSLSHQNVPLEVFVEMSPEQAAIYSYAVQSGETSLELVETFEEENQHFLSEKLLRSTSLGSFQSNLVTYMIRQLFPGVKVTVISTPRGFIVRGKVPDPQIAGKIMEIFAKLIPNGVENVVDMMCVKPQQVLLCVKFYEIQPRLIQRVGVNWNVLLETTGQILGFGAVFPAPAPNEANYYLAAASQVNRYVNLSALIDMLEEDRYTKVLAEPNLTTISGEPAHFFAGGEFPVLIPQGGALLGTVTVEFKKFGITLDFTPIVDLNGLITLHVIPEVSQIDRTLSVILNGFVIPGLRSRKADTTIKLWPGQSYLIAGLYLDEHNNINNNLYGLNKIPVIGSLFASNRYERQINDLLIIVTPYLIQDDIDNVEEDWDKPQVVATKACAPQLKQECFSETPWLESEGVDNQE